MPSRARGAVRPLPSLAKPTLAVDPQIPDFAKAWLGDVSEKGLQQSAGIMVNYLYRLDDIEAFEAQQLRQVTGSAAAASPTPAVPQQAMWAEQPARRIGRSIRA